MSDYEPSDGRPMPEGGPLQQCTVSDTVYCYHHAGLVVMEVGSWGIDGVQPSRDINVCMSPKQARYVVRELTAAIESLENTALK